MRKLIAVALLLVAGTAGAGDAFLFDNTVIGCDCTPELLSAAEGVLPCLRYDGMPPMSVTAEAVSISESLRRKAAEIDKCNAAFDRLREAIRGRKF